MEQLDQSVIEANYGKLDDALFLVYDLNPARFQKAYNLAKSDYDFSFQDKTSVVNGLVTHSVKDDGSRESVESMMTYAFIINQNPCSQTVPRYDESRIYSRHEKFLRESYFSS